MTEQSETAVLVSRPAAFVTQLQINRPKAMNALNGAVLGGIAAALADAVDDDEVRCVVLTGDQRAFAAGADIKEMPTRTPATVLTDKRGEHWHAVASFPKPIVAAVNGYALGGGCELAMSCDIIVAGENAMFGQPEVNLGIIAGAGGTQRLVKAVGKSVAMKMLLASEFIDAETALASGLVADVVAPELTLERAVALAETIASKAPLAVRLTKQAVLRSFDVSMEAGLQFERNCSAALFGTEDRLEGVTAFIEKRKAEFKNR